MLSASVSITLIASLQVCNMRYAQSLIINCMEYTDQMKNNQNLFSCVKIEDKWGPIPGETTVCLKCRVRSWSLGGAKLEILFNLHQNWSYETHTSL